LEVSLLSVCKGEWKGKKYLGHHEVDIINTFFGDSQDIGNPFNLSVNHDICFQGSVILGSGFILQEQNVEELFKVNPKSKTVIFKYLIGEDINNDIMQYPSRYVINFLDWNIDKAKTYPECFSILEKKVYVERQEKRDKSYREKWWQFGRRSVELYKNLTSYHRALVVCRVTKYLSFSFVPTNYVYDVGTNVILFDRFMDYAMLQSNIHECWARKYGSTLRFDLRYTNTDCFENYPFARNISNQAQSKLEAIGEEYYEFRKNIMINMQLGLTKTYNLFHNPKLTSAIVAKESKQSREIVEQAYQDILKLRQLHKEMDEAVLVAYGWSKHSEDPALAGSGIDLEHDFHEVDYLPENNRIRYTISEKARKEVLRRLLKLNHEIHEEEVKKGLWAGKKGKAKGKKGTVPANQDTLGL